MFEMGLFTIIIPIIAELKFHRCRWVSRILPACRSGVRPAFNCVHYRTKLHRSVLSQRHGCPSNITWRHRYTRVADAAVGVTSAWRHRWTPWPHCPKQDVHLGPKTAYLKHGTPRSVKILLGNIHNYVSCLHNHFVIKIW